MANSGDTRQIATRCPTKCDKFWKDEILLYIIGAMPIVKLVTISIVSERKNESDKAGHDNF